MFYNMLPSIVKNHTYTNSLEIIIKRAIESSNLAYDKGILYAAFKKYKIENEWLMIFKYTNT